MPALIGSMEFVSVSGVLEFADTGAIVPKAADKAYVGSGNFLTGDMGKSLNLVSFTNTNDLDLADSNVGFVK